MRKLTLWLVLAAAALGQVAAPVQPQAIEPRARIKLFSGTLEGWYTYLKDSKYEDPRKVFSVMNGVIRISGEEWGGIATKQQYRDYHLILEWRWGKATWGERKNKARDSGILVHAVGEDGAYSGMWLESIESQMIEGGSGDFILVGGKNRPSMTAEVREGERGEVYWQPGGKRVTRDRGRFNWYARDPKWKDELGFRGIHDVEKPVGEWNRQEVIADGDSVINVLNGVVVNRGMQASHTSGKIQLQSEAPRSSSAESNCARSTRGEYRS